MNVKAWMLATVKRSLVMLGVISVVLPVSLVITYNTLLGPPRDLSLQRIQQQTIRLKTLLSIPETNVKGHDAMHRSRSATRYIHPSEYCEDVSRDNINPAMFQHIIYNDKYKILYCQVPKVACTNWRRILLLLSGRMNSTDPMKLPAGQVHNRYDKYLNYLSDLSVEDIRYRIKHYFKFMFTREPFERVLSAYRNKFQTKNDFFHSRFGKRIILRYRANARGTVPAGHDVTFLEYLQYLTDYTRTDPLNEHWERMTHLCHPCVINYDVASSYDDLEKNSDKVLRKIGVANKVRFPKRSVSYKHIGTDRLLRQYYREVPPALLDQLMEVYYPDFLMFHYKVPSSIRNLTRWQVKL